MSDEEKMILKQAQKQKRLEKVEDLEQLEGIKKELFEEVKKQLPEIISQKKQELAEALSKKGGLEYARIYSLISKNDFNLARKSYSNEELFFALGQFKEMVNMILEKENFTPSKALFCAFIGVSTSTYDSWLRSNDEQRREVVQMIDDYIADVMLGMAQTRKIDSYTSIYRTKAQHGIVEQNAPIVIEHRAGADLDEIQNRINMIKKGSLVVEAEYKEKGK
jgi:hypothetical protein